MAGKEGEEIIVGEVWGDPGGARSRRPLRHPGGLWLIGTSTHRLVPGVKPVSALRFWAVKKVLLRMRRPAQRYTRAKASPSRICSAEGGKVGNSGCPINDAFPKTRHENPGACTEPPYRPNALSKNLNVGIIWVAMKAGSSWPAVGTRVRVEFAPALTNAS